MPQLWSLLSESAAMLQCYTLSQLARSNVTPFTLTLGHSGKKLCQTPVFASAAHTHTYTHTLSPVLAYGVGVCVFVALVLCPPPTRPLAWLIWARWCRCAVRGGCVLVGVWVCVVQSVCFVHNHVVDDLDLILDSRVCACLGGRMATWMDRQGSRRSRWRITSLGLPPPSTTPQNVGVSRAGTPSRAGR